MRKIHLDFHTSEKIPILQNWNKNLFIKTLKDAHVSQIVCFAKGHHGNCYWDSKIGPKHPYLPDGLDLLKEQIEVCHANNIRINAYYSCMWDQQICQNLKKEFDKKIELDEENDDDSLDSLPKVKWMQVNAAGIPAFNENGWGSLCLNSSYVEEIIIPHTLELLEYDIDGIWFDICRQKECYCDSCKKLHEKWGLDLNKAEDKIKLESLTMSYWIPRVLKVIRERKPKIEVFFNTIDHFGAIFDNGSDNEPFIVNNVQDAWEQESLPTGGWGYWYFPAIGRYFRAIPYSDHASSVIPKTEPRLYGMTGMFRGHWGDNGSLKSSRALLTESASIISLGFAGVDIGDQLHPTGKLEPAVYETIGKAFQYVEEREPWIKNSFGLADVAVIASTPGTHGPPNVLKGLTKMLVENHVQFDLIDQGIDIDPKYKLVIVPDYDLGPNEKMSSFRSYLPLSNNAWLKISEYVKHGGKVVVFGKGPCGKTLGNIVFPETDWDLSYDVCYLTSDIPPKSDNYYPEHQYVLYNTYLKLDRNEMDIKSFKDSEKLVDLYLPYSKRGPNNFTSHMHWPVNRLGGVRQPAVVKKDNIIWFLVPLCKEYWEKDYDNHRELFKAIIKKFVPDQLLDAANYPPSCEINLTIQPEQKRIMLHIINWGAKRPGAKPIIHEAPFNLPQGKISINLSGFKNFPENWKPNSILSCKIVPENKDFKDYVLKTNGGEKIIELNIPPTGFNTIIEIRYSN